MLLHGRLEIHIHGCKDLPKMDLIGKTDPYISIHLGVHKLLRTEHKRNTHNPTFDRKYYVYVNHECDSLVFKVKDQDASQSEMIGEYCMSVVDLVKGKEISGNFLMTMLAGKKKSTIELTVQFYPANSEIDDITVPRTYFKEQNTDRVKLFHDAHVPEEDKHQIILGDGSEYHDESLWLSIIDSIENAKEFIYIAGWSVFDKVKLKRDEEFPTLGEMLVKKAAEGVEVRVLVWDEALSTSNTVTGVTDGLMGTHDEETYNFFKHTKVHCSKVPRDGGDKSKGLLKRIAGAQAMYFSFTHHQKTICFDNGASGDAIRCAAYVGGIDLCDGRFDTPKHRLFRGLGTSFPENDFHQPNAGDGSMNFKTGPRQPWHDIHGYLEGPAALDVLENFTERWKKQAKHLKIIGARHFKDDLFKSNGNKSSGDDWGVQIFRSIDQHSNDFARLKDTEYLNKTFGSEVDQSIHNAYVHQIRRAQNFIYIENQYFLGSSHEWNKKNEMCAHLIPLEITHKIISKINAEEDFCVFITIPFWPEGPTDDGAISEILLWQSSTVTMMYKKIGEAIALKGLDVKPTRYLKFFCPVNRETIEGDSSTAEAAAGTYAARVQTSRRFMIYVHSKMMIVDDEYIIVGSANINMRSMAGLRDSEICFGAYQKEHRASKDKNPQADIQGFRLALWAEHLGVVEETFKTPQKAECSARVMELAEENWNKFIGDEVVEMDAHLIPYPYSVSSAGVVSARIENFPDTANPIMGSSSGVIPDFITT